RSCHWDGYLSNNGAILLEHYNTAERVEKLLDLGDLSSLGQELSTDEPHSYDNPADGVCIAYGRDRGETDMEARFEFSYQHMQKEHYNYIFKDGKWFYFRGDNFNKIHELTVESIELNK